MHDAHAFESARNLAPERGDARTNDERPDEGDVRARRSGPTSPWVD